jgi:hypothetical protein
MIFHMFGKKRGFGAPIGKFVVARYYLTHIPYIKEEQRK